MLAVETGLALEQQASPDALGGPELPALAAVVEDSLRQAGLPAPLVTIRPVAALDRDPLTGKARRFIPLGTRPPQ